MIDSGERRWRRQMADEAKAIATQQASAGETHSPMKRSPAAADFKPDECERAGIEQAHRDCAELLDALIQDFRSRAELAIPLADLQALVARIRATPKAPS
jgi:hypothetical protein